ncbi:hypothetical protein TRVA0_002S01750 [Trichomonascus vanleenenianus]|uniref:uncharacterized protein n=1 Tax=Trichomonascus vanleenenianus TaxID=2268995 RepID=UPI003ECABC2B
MSVDSVFQGFYHLSSITTWRKGQMWRPPNGIGDASKCAVGSLERRSLARRDSS